MLHQILVEGMLSAALAVDRRRYTPSLPRQEKEMFIIGVESGTDRKYVRKDERTCEMVNLMVFAVSRFFFVLPYSFLRQAAAKTHKMYARCCFEKSSNYSRLTPIVF